MKHTIKRFVALGMSTAVLSITGAAYAAAPVPYFSSNCANCHGTDGKSVTPIMPKLAGQDREFILETLRAYKAGTRSGTIMPQLSKGYTDEEFVQLADYFSSVK
jgi:sulfide dehydrogenase cytochrome subunit